MVVAACASASAGWTFAPQPSITAAPSAAASTGGSSAPSAPATAAASSAPGSSPDPGGSAPAGGGTPGETTIRVKAQNIAFDTQQIQAPGGQSFIIQFDNQDQGIPHNIAIRDPSGIEIFKGEIFNGPGQRAYQVPALSKGVAYTFACDVHPTMTGTVVVQ